MLFIDRVDAGLRLAHELRHLRGTDVVVLGLPRGGVPVAHEVAAALGAPLDVIVVRKLGVPFQRELAMGAIGEDDVRVFNEEVLEAAHVSAAELAEVERQERAVLERRIARFRHDRARVPLAGRVAVVVDDGLATGATARVACLIARAAGASRVVLAVPVAPAAAIEAMREVADDVVCLETPDRFLGVGQWYKDFSPVNDNDVVALLDRAAANAEVPAPLSITTDDCTDDVVVDLPGVSLPGRLAVPDGTRAAVVFAHASGSSRHSARNRYVAEMLNDAGVATLLFDLLSADEEIDRSNVFDVSLLAGRLRGATAWLRGRPELGDAAVGYLGANTGTAAALWAAAEPETRVAAVVSRGGRPDLAGSRLAAVRSPTLLVVGGNDEMVLILNRAAQERMRCETRLSVVPGASHLFEEPGTLAQVAHLATDWFLDHLTPCV